MKLYKKIIMAVGSILVVAMPLLAVGPQFVGHAAAADAQASWKDDYKTLSFGADDYTGPNDGPETGQVFFTNGTAALTDLCKSIVVFNTTNLKTATTAQYGSAVQFANGCVNFKKTADITVDPTANNPGGAGDPGGGTTGGGDTSEDGGGGDIDPCNATSDFLSWIICPVINLINGAINIMQGIINHLLVFDVTTVFKRGCGTDCQTGQAYYSAWNSFRLLGVAIIVITGLVMVISQALGFEIFDAYTIKKTLPRLLIAAIGISLSWYLLEFLANFTNDVGMAIRNMIYWPFRNLSGNVGLDGWSGLLAGDLAVGAIFGILTLGGVLSFVVTAGLAALVAFLVLVARQIVLTFLVLIAPLAIALFVLPNTQKAYKLWWESTSRGFMMFPIISAFIATGRVFSVVAANAGGGGVQGTFNQIISLIAYFLPYFALPFTFRLAGGALATIGGLANDRSRGTFDRLKNFRRQGAAGKHQRRMEGQTRFGSSAAGSLYRRAALLGDPNSGAASLSNAKFRETERRMLAHTAAEALKNDNGRFAGDDTANRLAAERGMTADRFRARYAEEMKSLNPTMTDAEAQQKAREALGGIESSYGARLGSDAMRVTAAQAWAASSTGADSGEKGWADRREVLGSMVRDGLMTATDAAAAVKGNAKRADGSGASFGEMIGYFNAAAQGKTFVNSDGDVLDDGEMLERAISGAQPGALLAGHKKAVVSAAPVMLRTATEAAAAATPTDRKAIDRELAEIAGRYDVMAQVSPDSAKVMADGVMAKEIEINGVKKTIQAHIEEARANPDFVQMRREYQSAQQQAAAGTPLINGGAGGLGGGAAGGTPIGGINSDRRIKRSLKLLTTTNDGVNIYQFRYLWSNTVYVGVMAQELLDTHPWAVIRGKNGYYKVDYASLGLQMMTLEEWKAKSLTGVER